MMMLAVVAERVRAIAPQKSSRACAAVCVKHSQAITLGVARDSNKTQARASRWCKLGSLVYWRLGLRVLVSPLFENQCKTAGK